MTSCANVSGTMSSIAVVPAYEPTGDLVGRILKLREHLSVPVVVVDDGTISLRDLN